MKNRSNNEAKNVLEKEPISSDDDRNTDSMSDQSSYASETQTQFSVLRSDTDGLRMKISAIRTKNVSATATVDSSSNKKGTSDNNNSEKSKLKKDSSKSLGKKSKTMSVVPTSSSCCSVCSQSDIDTTLEAFNDGKTTRKIKLKRKKINKNLSPETVNDSNSSDSEQESEKKKKNDKTNAKAKPLASKSDKCLPVLTENHSCLSSSDNELPALVSAAIKCVETDSEPDICPLDVQPTTQYTSTLLQDFMVKTQMVGQNFETISQQTGKSELSDVSSSTQSKKKRGRPKKASTSAASIVNVCVNESVDSGITSTAQSSSPSPRNAVIAKKSLSKLEPTVSLSPLPKENVKPKLDITSLDKRMYATERVLYPPPRTKRRVSNAAKQSNLKLKTPKEDALDPIWRKIDINTKFRRPSLSGYKSDGGNTVCSKVLAAKSGYISDYGSVYARNHYSGYKSDASCKSRFSMRSCASRVSRAKSCSFRSECGTSKNRKFRRKRRSMMKHAKSVGNVNEQDILQLAGLSLGQSSEESNEYVCKPLPLPSVNSAKKLGEINRFVTTGEYFGRSKDKNETADDGEVSESLLGNKLCLKSDRATQLLGADFSNIPRKIKSRRSSAASFCSSYYSGVSKYRKRRRRKSFRYGSKSCTVDSKLSTEIDIIINSFASQCRINGDKQKDSNKVDKEKQTSTKVQNKRNLKKRKLSESADYALLSISGSGAATKRRHKKACSSSPDDHKLPLKKRHYLLTPGEKSEAKAAAAAAALFVDVKLKEIGEGKGSGKGSSGGNGKMSVTPKKRHLLQTTQLGVGEDSGSNSPSQVDSKVNVKNGNDASAGRKRSRLEGLVTKMATTTPEASPATSIKEQSSQAEAPTYPPPGVFEPSIELEIQIPITKLAESSIITKSEVDSPLDLIADINKPYPEQPKTERVVEKLLTRTGANLILKRKRKKINRTGFPSVKKKKRKLAPSEVTKLEEKIVEQCSVVCDRVPHTGEASATFLERNKVPRLSVVSLERLQMPPMSPVSKEKVKVESQVTRRKSTAVTAKATKRTASIPKLKEEEPASASARRSRQRSSRIEMEDRKTEYTTKTPKETKLPPVRRKRGAALKQEEVKIEPNKQSATPKSLKKEKPEKSEKVETSEVQDKTENAESKSENEHLEQEPLPYQESNFDSESTFSDTSEDKPNGRKKWKKTYLPAGLLSDYFKIPNSRVKKSPPTKDIIPADTSASPTPEPLLPPPPYCEKFFRKTVTDFMLPYDVWYAHTNSKLPARNNVPSWNYKKIRTNIYAEAVRPNTTNLDHPTCNCKAENGCGDDCLNRMVYTECSPSCCPNKEKCRNQKIQRHDVAPGVERFMTDDKGWGVRTKQPIKKGTYILEYVGEVVTEKEFKERMATLYVHDTHHYCLHLDGGLVIDGHRMGSDGRFVNHSCQPNCEMQKWSVNGLSRMALFASRNIDPDEELTYDYNFSLFNPSEGQPCKCNTSQCRGVIGGKSQRIKPLELKSADATSTNTARNGRQRKRQAKKNNARLQSKDVIVHQLQPITDKEKKIIRTARFFLVRNLEKIRRLRTKPIKKETPSRPPTPSSTSSLAVQISALRVPRNIKTRGLTQAAIDPEVEKMAKIALLLKEICSTLEGIKDDSEKPQILKLVPVTKKKRSTAPDKKTQSEPISFSAVQQNIEKGFYKDPLAFDEDMQNIFATARNHSADNDQKKEVVDLLTKTYADAKTQVSARLSELVDAKCLKAFCPSAAPVIPVILPAIVSPSDDPTEDVIGCICGMFKDEGLMIQCARCSVWQHTECTKADVNAENYLCEKCEPRVVDYEIPLDEFTEDGHRYYLSLLRGDLQIRQGDTVYVLRDIPIKDENGVIQPTKKHTYQTIGDIDYTECDIFRAERLWKDNDGKRFIFGHHFLRPHETYHEPSRKFYPNEVVRVPLYEVVPIELVIDRCWVLDRTTFCKGRPVDCTSEDHVYICELRVDKTARLFTKAKQNYPTCTKNYAFRKFTEKLKISKSYAPHEVDPSLMKKKPKLNESINSAQSTPQSKKEKDKDKDKEKDTTRVIPLLPPPSKTIAERRNRLEDVLKNLKVKFNTQMLNTPAVDLSYLLSGRGARQRKAIAATVPPIN